jgi:hypothetical protein
MNQEKYEEGKTKEVDDVKKAANRLRKKFDLCLRSEHSDIGELSADNPTNVHVEIEEAYGDRDYKKGDFEQAKIHYEKALENSLALIESLGASLELKKPVFHSRCEGGNLVVEIPLNRELSFEEQREIEMIVGKAVKEITGRGDTEENLPLAA